MTPKLLPFNTPKGEDKLKVLIIDGHPNAWRLFDIKPTEKERGKHWSRWCAQRHVSCMTRLHDALNEHWDLVFVYSLIAFSVHARSKSTCKSVQTARMLAARYSKKKAITIPGGLIPSPPLVVLSQEDWDHCEAWIEPLHKAGIPWVNFANKDEIMWFSDYHDMKNVNEKEKVNVSIRSPLTH